jgi:CcmD family protein
MDPILAEIYSTVFSAAPYVIVAYALIWSILLVYVLIISNSMKKTERQISALEEELANRSSQ